MLVVYHEAFSDRYLITLVPSDIPKTPGWRRTWNAPVVAAKSMLGLIVG